MKDKFLSQEEFKEILNSGGKLVFYTTSPLSEITDPSGMIFFALHWHLPLLMNTTGTAYVCRIGNPLDFDLYSIYRSSDEENSKIFIKDIEKDNIGYHHANNLPKVIKDEAPNWINVKIAEVTKKLEN